MQLQPLSLGILAFFLGSIPFSLIVSKLKGVDLRNIGSGNLGATNVYRAMGWKYAFVVFLLDAIKGYIPTHLALNHNDPLLHILIGFMAILGHSLTPFARFKGGKGAATGLGVLMAISPDVCGILIVVASLLIYFTRYVAPVTLLCSVLAPILLWFFHYPSEYGITVSLISLFIVYRHKANIIRLIQGKENRL